MNTWLARDEPIIGLSATATRRLHRFAFTWSVVAIVALTLTRRFGVLDTRPGRTAFPITIQPVFMLMFGVALLIALRSEIIGGTIAAFTAAGLGVFAAEQLVAPHAVAVVGALLVPGIAWIVIDLQDFRPRVALAAIGVIGIAVASGGWIARDAYVQLFGPAHPESSTPSLDLPVEWIWVGGVTTSEAVVVASIPDPSDPLIEVRRADGDHRTVVAASATNQDGEISRFEATGLAADTEYVYGLVDPVSAGVSPLGSFRTMPAGAADFTIAVSSCARTGSNGAVFDAIAATDPLLYLVTGDIHYANIDDGDRDAMVEVMELAVSRSAPAALYRSTSVAYVWDDHDFGGDGSDRNSPSRNAVQDVYREVVPHHLLPDEDGSIHQAFTIGRVRFVLTDVRSNRSPAAEVDDETKTMLGAEQRAWLEREIVESATSHAAVIWVNPVPWIAAGESGADHWGGYTTERRELADVIAANEIDNLIMVSGDAHMVAIDDGTNSDYSTEQAGGFPVLHAAALDRPGRIKGGPYSEGAIGGAGQFATISIVDDGGSSIEIELVARSWSGDELLSHRVTFDDVASGGR